MDENHQNDRQEHRRWRGSIVWPVILVGIGLVFLLNNLGALPGNAWDNIIRLWPVLLIAFGLDGILRREGLVGPVFLIGLGVVFLLSNLGYLTLDVWQAVLRLWPVLLIAFGIDIIFGRRSAIWSVVGLILVLAVLAGALWLAGVRLDRGQALTTEQISQPLEGAQQARVAIQPAVGSLRLDAMPASSNLVEGEVRQGPGERISQDFTLSGETAVYTLDGTGGIFVGGSIGREGSWNWNLSLTPDIPLDLQTSLGAGEAEIDLTGLNLSDLDVELGIGSARVTLPEQGRFEGRIEGAIGQVVVLVPQGMAVRIHADTGIANIDVAEDFQLNGDSYTSPAYAGATERIELDVSQAIGNIQIRWK